MNTLLKLRCITIVILLICSVCVAPVMAGEDLPGDLPNLQYVVVQDERGVAWLLSTSADVPDPWFSWVKPFDTVKIVHDDAGYAYAIISHPAVPHSSSCWPFPCARAQPQVTVPVVGGGIVAVYLVPGVGEVALVATGVVIVGGATYYIATSDEPICKGIRTSFTHGTAQLQQWGNAAVTNEAERADQVRALVQSWVTERDYNDAKDHGIPTKNHDETNSDNREVGQKGLPGTGKPHSSRWHYGKQVDKQNGCPKQIRYYGKDGNAELDIDFGHPGSMAFPHKHTWTNGKRSEEHLYDGIEKVIENWKCKDYDFLLHKFKKKSDL